MKILITGAAGFIGFNFSNFLLKKTNIKVIGIDNLNDYYDVSLKKKRLSILKKKKINPRIRKVALQKADIIKTHGNNAKLLKYIEYNRFANWKEPIIKVIDWYKNNMI